ncbi:Monoacylglycerol lipase ABHD6 [Senna tora]|uniref:Monoacylglycerol lipase ABHD6 n=1 Tax=Senna tora TaxID=362788 RepID=A0A834XA46_9FABA|nr:Monoacylglycerol lipase ABHD6 [Senna tora]
MGENAELVVIKNAGHALNIEKPKVLFKNLKSFLFESSAPTTTKQESHSNGNKQD